MSITLIPNAPSAADGYYAKYAKARAIAGSYNLAAFSNLNDDTTTEDATVEQIALNAVDNYVDERARYWGVASAVDGDATSPHLFGPSNVSFARISDLASQDAVVELYQRRGMTQDDNQGAQGLMTKLRKTARDELDAILQRIAIQQAQGTAGTVGIEVIPAAPQCRTPAYCPPPGMPGWGGWW